MFQKLINRIFRKRMNKGCIKINKDNSICNFDTKIDKEIKEVVPKINKTEVVRTFPDTWFDFTKDLNDKRVVFSDGPLESSYFVKVNTYEDKIEDYLNKYEEDFDTEVPDNLKDIFKIESTTDENGEVVYIWKEYNRIEFTPDERIIREFIMNDLGALNARPDSIGDYDLIEIQNSVCRYYINMISDYVESQE